MFYGYKSKAYFNEIVGHAIFTKRCLDYVSKNVEKHWLKQIAQANRAVLPDVFRSVPNLPHSTPLKLLALTQKL